MFCGRHISIACGIGVAAGERQALDVALSQGARAHPRLADDQGAHAAKGIALVLTECCRTNLFILFTLLQTCTISIVRAPCKIRNTRTHAHAQGFFSTSHESPIGFAPFVETLVECAAPVDAVNEYARLVADADERFHLCVHLMLYDVAIEVRTCFVFDIMMMSCNWERMGMRCWLLYLIP